LTSAPAPGGGRCGSSRSASAPFPLPFGPCGAPIPCPCGWLSVRPAGGLPLRRTSRQRYWSRLVCGPLLDRFGPAGGDADSLEADDLLGPASLSPTGPDNRPISRARNRHRWRSWWPRPAADGGAQPRRLRQQRPKQCRPATAQPGSPPEGMELWRQANQAAAAPAPGPAEAAAAKVARTDC